VSHTVVTQVAQDGQDLQQVHNDLLLQQQPVLLLTQFPHQLFQVLDSILYEHVPRHPYPIVHPISTEGEDFVYIGNLVVC
jgi:hypothetical protein